MILCSRSYLQPLVASSVPDVPVVTEGYVVVTWVIGAKTAVCRAEKIVTHVGNSGRIQVVRLHRAAGVPCTRPPADARSPHEPDASHPDA